MISFFPYNTILCNTRTGINIQTSSYPSSSIYNIIFSSNTILFNGGNGINIGGLYGEGYMGEYGAAIYNITVSSSAIQFNTGAGINMQGYSWGGGCSIHSVNISSNDISSNKRNGIGLLSTATYGNTKICNVMISSNIIHWNNGDGVYLKSRSEDNSYIYNVILSSNTISSNEENGIYATSKDHYTESEFDLTISDSIISANGQKAIWIHGGINSNLSYNSISYSRYGVMYTSFYTGMANNTAQYNDIYRNLYGMNVTNGATVNAENNYWGAPNGPYHKTLNFNGTGNSVNGNGTDLDFIPFLTESVGQINERPTAILVADKTTIKVNQTVTFNASASTDDGQIDYYFFNYGDGTNSSWTTQPIVTHTYTLTGTYNATLTVMDNFGVPSLESNLTYVTIRVTVPPIANFSYAPEYPGVGETVIFNASNSYAPYGSIQSYMWNFGDGNITTVSTPIIMHPYSAQGIYVVNLTVINIDGLSSSVTKSVTVDSTPPVTFNDYDGLWHTTNFTIILTATDGLSGVAEIYYKINDGPTKLLSIDGQPYIITEGTDNKLEYWSVDNAGNEELPHNFLTGIKLDKTYPLIGIPLRVPSGDVESGQSVRVSLNVTDALSGVKSVTLYYTIDDGASWTTLIMNYSISIGLYEALIPGQQAGTQVKFKIVAYDNAGNNATVDGEESHCIYQVIPELLSKATMLTLLILITIPLILIRKKRKAIQKKQRHNQALSLK